MSDLTHLQRYLKKQHVLSLCCGNGQQLWCANCFYIFNAEKMAFWLMSDADTRHGSLIKTYPRVAGTINGQPESVLQIKGVQYQGDIRQLTNTEAEYALPAYLARFPIARVRQAPLWEIRLNELKMTDNALGFGKKIYWQRHKEEKAE